MKSLNKYSLIAPCGMNCGICMAYLREKNRCLGCRTADTNKAVSVHRCKIKNCEVIQKRKLKYGLAPDAEVKYVSIEDIVLIAEKKINKEYNETK